LQHRYSACAKVNQVKADFIILYYIQDDFRLIDINTYDFFHLRQESIARGDGFKINPQHSITNVRKHFISQRIVKNSLWIEIPPTYVEFTSLNAFEKCFLELGTFKFDSI